MNTYTQDYVDGCRAAMEAQLAAYRELLAAGGKKIKAARQSFDPLFFNNLVVVLEGYFVHRSRTLERKDGNILNEVRMLRNSILLNQGIMTADKTIKYQPSKSILKIEIGQPIRLTEADLVPLLSASLPKWK